MQKSIPSIVALSIVVLLALGAGVVVWVLSFQEEQHALTSSIYPRQSQESVNSQAQNTEILKVEVRELIGAGWMGIEQLAWSPDGKWLAFVPETRTPQGENRLDIRIIPVEGTKEETIENERGISGFYTHSPAWSPDGKKMAYGTRGGVWIANTDGTNAVLLAGQENPNLWDRNLIEGGKSVIDWSPDGNQIVLVMKDTETTPYQIWIMDVDGSNLQQLTYDQRDKRNPQFSPDGTRILYEAESKVFVERIWDYPYESWVMDANGGNRRKLIASGKELKGYTFSSTERSSWSPDGKNILIDEGITWIIASDGIETTLLPYPHAVWGPNGRKLAYAGGGIWIMNSDGTNRIQVSKLGGSPIAWSPDGKRIAFVTLQGFDFIYLIEFK